MKKILIALLCLSAGPVAFAHESRVVDTAMRPVRWAGDVVERPIRYTGDVLDEHVVQPIREIFPDEERFDEGREMRLRRGTAPNHR